MAGVHIYAAMAAVVMTAFVILHTDVWFDKAGKYYQQPYHDKPVAEICLPDGENASVPGLNCSDCAWLDNKVSFADSPFSLAQTSKDSDEAPPGLSACGYPRHSLSSNRDYHSVVESSAKPERRHSATNHPKCAKRLKVGPGLFAPIPVMIEDIIEGSGNGVGDADSSADSSEWCDGKTAPKNVTRCAAFVRNVARQHLAALAPSNPMLRANPKRRDGVGREEVRHRGKAHRMFAARARDFCGKSAEVGWPSFSATTPPASEIKAITDRTGEARAAMAQLTSKKRKIAADTWLGAMKYETGVAKSGTSTSCSMQKRWADGPTDKTLKREAKEFLAMVTMGYNSRSTTTGANRGNGHNSIWWMCDDMFERARIKATGSFTKTAPPSGTCNRRGGPPLLKYNAEITGSVKNQWATENEKVNLDAAFKLATLISWSDDERSANCSATTTITTDSSTATTTPIGNTTAANITSTTTTPTTPVDLSPGQGPLAYDSCNIVTPWHGVAEIATVSVDFGMFDIKCESSVRSRFVGTCMHTALHTCPKESCGMQDAIRDYLREGKEPDRCYGTATCTSVGNVSGAIIYNNLKYMPSLKAEPPSVQHTLQEVIWPPNNHGGDTTLSMSEAYEDGVRWFVARWSTTLFSTLVTMFVVLAAIAWKMGHEIPARIMVSLAGVTVFTAMLFMYYGAYGKGIGDHVPRSVDYMGGTDDANFGALTYGAAITHPRAAATVSLMAVLALLAFVNIGNDSDKTKAVSMGVFVGIFLLCLMDALAIMLGGQGDSVSEDHMCRSNFRLVLWWAIGGSLAAVSLVAAAFTHRLSAGGDKMKFYLAAIVVILVLRHPFFLVATKIPANRACLPSVLSSQMFKAGTFGTHLITIGALAAMAIVTDSELEASTSSMGSGGMFM